MGTSLKLGSLFGVPFIWVPYYIGDPKGDPNLENYPYDPLSNKQSYTLVLMPLFRPMTPKP